MSKIDPFPPLAKPLAVEILNKTLDAFQHPDNIQKIEQAKETGGNEMIKMMQSVFPIVMQIQINVIKEYGFEETREGILKFSQMIRGLEREDSEVARLHGIIKGYYLPPEVLKPSHESGEGGTSSN